jgi:predicted Zn finger-like uncharacterized protein
MSLQTTCPHCQARLSLAEDLHGTKVRCGNCKQLFVVEEEVPERGDAIEPEVRSWTLQP